MILSSTPDSHDSGRKSLSPVQIYSNGARGSRFWSRHPNALLGRQMPVASFWTRNRHFAQLVDTARQLRSVEKGWDGYAAPGPSEVSVRRAVSALEYMRNVDLSPWSVLPSADGGVGISFRGREGRRAVIEILNDGSSSYLTYGRGYTAAGSDFDYDKGLYSVLQVLMEYL